MNNFVSHYGLVDARISTSDKDLPVQTIPKWQNLTIFFSTENENLDKKQPPSPFKVVEDEERKCPVEIW